MKFKNFQIDFTIIFFLSVYIFVHVNMHDLYLSLALFLSAAAASTWPNDRLERRQRRKR